MFDLSNYSKDSKLFDSDNEKVIGKMKNEIEGKIINEFVALKRQRYILQKMLMVKKTKQEKEFIKMLLKMQNMKMFCLIKKWWGITWKEFKVNCIQLELMMFVKFLCLVLMIKDAF